MKTLPKYRRLKQSDIVRSGDQYHGAGMPWMDAWDGDYDKTFRHVYEQEGRKIQGRRPIKWRILRSGTTLKKGDVMGCFGEIYSARVVGVKIPDFATNSFYRAYDR